MPRYFFDSSALVKRYRSEAGSNFVIQLLTPQNHPIIHRLSHIEVTSAILRRSQETADAAAQASAALAMLNKDVSEIFNVVEFDDAVVSQAFAAIAKHRLRASDAIQLAAAMLSKTGDTDLILVSSDLELNAAAAAEGLSVENPDSHA